MVIKKIQLIVETTNDIFPEEINKDLDFYYKRMYDGHQVNQTHWKVIKCNITDVL